MIIHDISQGLEGSTRPVRGENGSDIEGLASTRTALFGPSATGERSSESTGSLVTPQLPILPINIRSFFGAVFPCISGPLSGISTLPRADGSGWRAFIVMFSVPNGSSIYQDCSASTALIDCSKCCVSTASNILRPSALARSSNEGAGFPQEKVTFCCLLQARYT